MRTTALEEFRPQQGQESCSSYLRASQENQFIFGVLALGGKKMFKTEGAEGQSLKKTLQSKEHIQLSWDICQDTETFSIAMVCSLGPVSTSS
jgi:hypothetical protein